MRKSWADVYQVAREDKVAWNEVINKFRTKYPVLGKSIDWGFIPNYANGVYTDGFDEEIFRNYEHLESYSKWRKKIQDEYDHQKIDSIKIRINQLQSILHWFNINKEIEIVRIAEIEMMPGILSENTALNQLLEINKLTKIGIGNFDMRHTDSAFSSEEKLRVSQSNLVYILHNTFENFQKIRDEFNNDTEIARILFENFDIQSNSVNPISALNRAIPYKPKRKPKFDTKPIADKLLQIFSQFV